MTASTVPCTSTFRVSAKAESEEIANNIEYLFLGILVVVLRVDLVVLLAAFVVVEQRAVLLDCCKAH